MKDTRLDIASSLLDDARDLLIEIVDEKPENVHEVNQLDAARLFINAADTHIRIAQGVKP
jgi:hypothetical protein